MCRRVKKSWDDVRLEIIVRSIKKCSTDNALDGTKDDALFDVSDSSSSKEDFLYFEDHDSSGNENDKSVSQFSNMVLVYVQVFFAYVMCC